MKLTDYIKDHTLLMDGAMGTYYQQLQEHKEEIAEIANFSEPELVLRIHKDYLEAGADIIRTNTFAINSVVLPNYKQDSREQLLVADLDLQAVQQYQKEFPVKKDRRDELYVVLSNMNI